MNRSLPRRITRENSAILRVVARHDLNRTAIPGKLAGERSSATPKPPDDGDADAKDGKDGKKKIRWSEAWQEASVLVWARRGRLALGLAVMLVNRLGGLVLPASSKYLIDDVIGKGRTELLMPIALGAVRRDAGRRR